MKVKEVSGPLATSEGKTERRFQLDIGSPCWLSLSDRTSAVDDLHE